MGMFDEITCRYPLPVEGANAFIYQTKCTPAQLLDKYEIREDGTLWHEAYDIRIEKTDDPLGAYMHRENKRWEPVEMTGEIRFYDIFQVDGWIEWSAFFDKGKLSRIDLVEMHQ